MAVDSASLSEIRREFQETGKFSPEQFESILPFVCERSTSSDPDNWTLANPLWGQYAVVSLVAQDLFGGELLRVSLEGVAGFEHLRSHYFNRLPDGSIRDFTRGQFGDQYPIFKETERRPRAYVLSFAESRERYKLLVFLFLRRLYGVSEQGVCNPLFYDHWYRLCLWEALDSPCQKMKFGCVAVRNFKESHHREEVFRSPNKTIGLLASFCEPECIRLSIQSRTESMLGACGHAEELVLWELIRQGLPVSECDFYIAGFRPNNMPWIKTQPDYTCLRCALQLYQAGVRKIYVPVYNNYDVRDFGMRPEHIDWAAITSEEAVKTAAVYARGEKSLS